MALGLVFLGMLLFAFLHFIVDGIIAPSEKLIVRLKLQRAADEVASMAREMTPEAKPFANRLRSALLNLINEMPRYSLWTFVMFALRFDHDPAFRADAKRRVQELDSCDHDDVQVVRKQLVRLGDKVFAWNSIGWSIYVLPVAACIAMVGKVEKALKALITMSPANLEQLDTNSAPLTAH